MTDRAKVTDHLFDWLKAMATPRLPLRLIEHRCDVDLVDADGNRADADTLYYAKEAANALPLLIAEIERLREQVNEYQEVLKPFARPFISERDNDDLEVGFPGITIRDYRRAKALLEKEG